MDNFAIEIGIFSWRHRQKVIMKKTDKLIIFVKGLWKHNTNEYDKGTITFCHDRTGVVYCCFKA